MKAVVKETIREIVNAGDVKRAEYDWYQVRAQSLNYESWHNVLSVESRWSRDCPHNQWMGIKCKHIQSVEYYLTVKTVVISGHVDQRLCKHCKSDRMCEDRVQHKQLQDLQLCRCKDCHKKFPHNIGFEKKRTESKHIASTLQIYFSRESLRRVQKYLKIQGVKVSRVTTYNWIVKYYKMIDQYTEKFTPKVGNKWRADEVFLKVKGKRKYLYALMDDDTRFWISQQVADTKYTEDVIPMFKKAKKGSRKYPEKFVTDGAKNFAESYRSQYMVSDTTHTRHIHLDGDKNNNKMERMDGEIRDREKITCGIKKMDSPIFKGLQIYYNYCRTRTGIDNKTPADKAGIIIGGDDK